MNKDIEKEIHRLIDDRVVSTPFIMYLKKCKEDIRRKIMNKIIEGVLGAAFSTNIITFIFRKEISELIEDTQKISKQALISFVNKISKFSSKKKN